MFINKYGLITLSSALILTSCATPPKPKVETPVVGPKVGIVYSLPATEFSVKVTREVKSCDSKGVHTAASFTVEEKIIDDPSSTYTLDPNKLSNFFNSVTTNIDFHPGTQRIKSFNSTTTDTLSASLSSIIKSGFSLLSPIGSSGGAADACNGPPEIKTTLESITKKTEAIKTKNDVLKTERLTLAEAVKEQADALPGRTNQLDKKVVDAKAKVESSIKLIEQLEERLKEEKASLTHASTHKLTSLNTTIVATLPEKVASKWYVAGGKHENELKINLTLETPVTISKTAAPADNNGHILYRPPGKGFIRAEGYQCTGDRPESCTITPLKKIDVQASQFGTLRSLSLKSRLFQSRGTDAEFALNGALISAGVAETSAQATGASSLLSDLSSEINSLRKEKANSQQSELDAELKQLETELKILQQQALINGQENPNETLAITDEVTLLNAQINRIKAQKELEALSAGE